MKKFWFDDINRFEDMIPCPHCLQPIRLQSYLSLTDPSIHGYSCRNESCMAFSEHTPITSYFSEFRLVAQRIADGYEYPKKVIAFAKIMVSISKKTKLLTPDDLLIQAFLARKHRATMSKRMLDRKQYQVLLKKEKPPKPRKIKVRE